MSNYESITHETIQEAVQNKLGVTEEIAHDIALRVLDYFGYEEEMIDNQLNQEDRRLFYFLQDVELLSTFWEEDVLPTTGRTWRIFYWKLNVEKIRAAARAAKDECFAEPDLYETLPEDIWSRETAQDA